MKRDFEGAEIIGQRAEEAIITEIEEKLRAEADQIDLEPLEEKSTGIELLEKSESVETEDEMVEYLNDVQGMRTADIVLRASRGDRRPDTLAEEVSINLQFDNQRFKEVYAHADRELDVEGVSFSFLGYGDSAVDAYEKSVPMIAFNLADKGGFTASYREDYTVIESIWSDNAEEVKKVYDILDLEDVHYRGAVIEGDKQDAWMISDYGSKELQEML